jgi:SAM-dependent methyltransferase
MDKEEITRRFDELPADKWYQRFEILKGSGIYTPGVSTINPVGVLQFGGLEGADLNGKRVLDIGADAGGFSFFFEDCGAKVMAIDPMDPSLNGFSVVHSIRKSSVEYHRASVYELSPDRFGCFDVVLFMAVLMHLRHPLLALERINSVCKPGSILVGSVSSSDYWFHNEHTGCRLGANFQRITKRRILNPMILSVENVNELSLCGFASGHYVNDPSSCFIPNRKCVTAWLETTGFKVNRMQVYESPLKWKEAEQKEQSKSWSDIKTLVSRVFNKFKKKLSRSSLTFAAAYSGHPLREFDAPGMQHCRIPPAYLSPVCNSWMLVYQAAILAAEILFAQ